MMANFTTRCGCAKVQDINYKTPPKYILVSLPPLRLPGGYDPDEMIPPRELKELFQGYADIEYRRFQYIGMSGTTALYREVNSDDE